MDKTSKERVQYIKDSYRLEQTPGGWRAAVDEIRDWPELRKWPEGQALLAALRSLKEGT